MEIKKQRKKVEPVKYIRRECGKEFEVKAEGKIKFAVCPNCGTDDIDHAKKEGK